MLTWLNGHAQMKAGKMKLIGTRLTPDKRKGTLRLFNSAEDTLLHLTWTSREVRLRARAAWDRAARAGAAC